MSPLAAAETPSDARAEERTAEGISASGSISADIEEPDFSCLRASKPPLATPEDLPTPGAAAHTHQVRFENLPAECGIAVVALAHMHTQTLTLTRTLIRTLTLTRTLAHAHMHTLTHSHTLDLGGTSGQGQERCP